MRRVDVAAAMALAANACTAVIEEARFFPADATAPGAKLAAVHGSDVHGSNIMRYDYPGRGGSEAPRNVDSAIALDADLLAPMRARGRIGGGRLILHGLSFGGSPAAAMPQGGGIDAPVIANSAADIASVGRNFVP